MKRISQKLKSEHGASFLLALLLFLICVMVGTSVLTAATSNASRIRYQQKEEQACLAVSSALRCVVDELLETTYYGQYSVTENNDKTVYKQIPCELVVETEGSSPTSSQMKPILQDDLDAIFGQYMWDLNAMGSSANKVYEILLVNKKIEHTLVTAVEGMDGLEDYEVTIRLTVHDSYSMDLTAELTGAPEDSQDCIGYEMKAELTPGKTQTPQLESDESEGLHQSTAMTWTLGKITGKE